MTQEPEQYDPTSTAGVPEHGVERLTRMRERSFFTSDLSVNEFLLEKAAGFEPLGLVVGSSIYHIGFQVGAWYIAWVRTSISWFDCQAPTWKPMW